MLKYFHYFNISSYGILFYFPATFHFYGSVLQYLRKAGLKYIYTCLNTFRAVVALEV